MPLVFIMEMDCVLCEVQVEAEEAVDPYVSDTLLILNLLNAVE